MELTPIVSVRRVVPMFTLPDKHGTDYNFAKQRGRDHVVLIVLRSSEGIAAYLQSLAQQATDWRSLPARGMVIVQDGDVAGSLGSLPFTILIDQNQRVADRFLPAEAQAGVFVLDRYGELYEQWIRSSVADLPPASDINDWLQAVSAQCSI